MCTDQLWRPLPLTPSSFTQCSRLSLIAFGSCFTVALYGCHSSVLRGERGLGLRRTPFTKRPHSPWGTLYPCTKIRALLPLALKYSSCSGVSLSRSEERRVGKECRSGW